MSSGTPGGAPATAGVGSGGGNFRPGATTAGTAGSYGRFVTQPFGGGQTPSMFGNTPGMFGNGTTSTNNGMQPTPLGGEPRAFGNAPLGDFPGGALPYGTPGANGIYGNASGVAPYNGGYGSGNYQGNYQGNYANNDTGYRGYSPYYGNNSGYGLSSGPLGTVGTTGQAFGNSSASMFQNSSGLQQLNNGTYNNERSYNGTYYNAGPYGNTAGSYGLNADAPGGLGVGGLGYANPLTPGSYSPSNPASGGTNSYAPQAYNYGMGAVPSGPGVGNLGYPNPVSTGSYPQAAPMFTPSTYGWF
jgi:hypothetical protein